MNAFNLFLEWLGAGLVAIFMVGYLGIILLEFFGYWDKKSKKS